MLNCALRRVNILRLFRSLLLIILLRRLSNNLAALVYFRVVMLTDFVITLAICIICQFAAPPPLVASPTNSKSRRPLNANLV